VSTKKLLFSIASSNRG